LSFAVVPMVIPILVSPTQVHIQQSVKNHKIFWLEVKISGILRECKFSLSFDLRFFLFQSFHFFFLSASEKGLKKSQKEKKKRRKEEKKKKKKKSDFHFLRHQFSTNCPISTPNTASVAAKTAADTAAGGREIIPKRCPSTSAPKVVAKMEWAIPFSSFSFP